MQRRCTQAAKRGPIRCGALQNPEPFAAHFTSDSRFSAIGRHAASAGDSARARRNSTAASSVTRPCRLGDRLRRLGRQCWIEAHRPAPCARHRRHPSTGRGLPRHCPTARSPAVPDRCADPSQPGVAAVVQSARLPGLRAAARRRCVRRVVRRAVPANHRQCTARMPRPAPAAARSITGERDCAGVDVSVLPAAASNRRCTSRTALACSAAAILPSARSRSSSVSCARCSVIAASRLLRAATVRRSTKQAVQAQRPPALRWPARSCAARHDFSRSARRRRSASFNGSGAAGWRRRATSTAARPASSAMPGAPHSTNVIALNGGRRRTKLP